MRKPITFVLSDESVVNSYGFKVRHSGIKMERFEANPVMLDSHWNSNRYVLGRWQNTRFEGTQMKAETDFDYDDKNISDIIGKVERKFIRGASLGLIFDPAHLAYDKAGELWLEESEQMEASICPVPSNGNSISLYDTKGVLLSEQDVRQMCLSATQSKNISKTNKPDMEKINLTAPAIVALASVGVTSADDVAAISKGIETLMAKLSSSESALSAANNDKATLQGKLDAQQDSMIKVLIDEAKLSGKILETEAEQYTKDAKENYDLTARMLSKLPAKKTLSGQIIKVVGDPSDTSKVKTVDDFMKLSVADQLAFKAENPAEYTALFAQD